MKHYSLRESLSDPDLLAHAIPGPSWSTWRTLLIASMGEKLTAAERQVFIKFTGRKREPLKRVGQFVVCAGRRAGKTQAVAAAGTYLAAVCDHRGVLAPGETGVLLCLAQDQRIAKKILDYIESNLRRSKILRQRFVARTQDAIELNNNIRIEVRPASFRKLRGPTYIGIIADELAFWYLEERFANPDVEVLAAARPGLLTTHGPLILASSPYAKRGVLWEVFSRYYGPDGASNILVAKGTTRDFNPTISKEEIDALLEEDPVRNASEYLAEFRGDIESFISLDAVEQCVGNYHELAPSPNISYFCYVDPAGGSGEGSFAAAITHRDGTQVITDAVREWVPPFQPDKVIADIAGLCKAYNIRTVYGDRFGDSFSAELFRQHNLIYEAIKRSKSDQYSALLPMLNAKRVVLPRHDRLVRQIVGLERQVTRAGHDSIDHAPGARDDIANALAGAAQLAHTALPSLWPSESFLDNGRAAELPPPKRVLCLFAVIVATADASQVGVAYFQGAYSPGGGLLYLVDALIAPPGAATLQAVHARFNEIFEQAPTCNVHGQQIFGNVPEVYCQKIIGDQLDVMLGRPVNTRPIDHLLASGDLALAAAMHIAKVRVTAAVLEKYGLGFLDGTAGRDSDVLRTAVLTGIVAGFDANRLITMSGPRRSPNANLKN
jgi:hypothetical protein